MKTKVVTVATHNAPGLEKLIESCKKFNIDLTILGMDEQWTGFAKKIVDVYKYAKEIQNEYTHILFIDAYDVLFLDKLFVIEGEYLFWYKDKIVFSAEKGCWPDPTLSDKYPKTNYTWKYLNSGSYIAPINEFIKMIESNPVKPNVDDQAYFTNIFLKDGNIELDYKCRLFQSIAFEEKGDFNDSPLFYFLNEKEKTSPSIIHGNGKTSMDKIYKLIKNNMNSLKEINEIWQDKPDTHKLINDTFTEKVNSIPELKAHRDFVDQNVHGFGERSFLWMWWLIVKEMPKEFSFLEIGVFKGAILSVIELMAKMQGKTVIRYGVTPLSTEGGVWESDYKADIERIHDIFNLAKDYTILQGLSEDPEIIKKAQELKVDILYIDGGHEEKHITNDIDNYVSIINKDGYLVIDDCANGFHMPWGYFQGIAEVSKVVEKKLPPFTKNDDFEFLFNVVHNMVFKKIK